jgi:hydroxyacylglutathione hydrolase
MSIYLQNFIIGPLQNNCYILLDAENNETVIIDPPLEVESIFPGLQKAGIQITRILLTHAHFDHIGGVKAVLTHFDNKPTIYLHQEELPLWRMKGNAAAFGMDIDLPAEPAELMQGEPLLTFGAIQLQTLLTPGHTRGHCTFYCQELAAAFCGDVIFHRSIGRTDFFGGDLPTLLDSIHTKILPLPPDTLLYPGHGPHTSVSDEMAFNPFLA